MKILMVLENQFPDDERVEKEALSLIKAGHEVHLLCATLKKERVGDENYKGIRLHRALSALALLFYVLEETGREFIVCGDF